MIRCVWILLEVLECSGQALHSGFETDLTYYCQSFVMGVQYIGLVGSHVLNLPVHLLLSSPPFY
jgi:hypothetical protein